MKLILLCTVGMRFFFGCFLAWTKIYKWLFTLTDSLWVRCKTMCLDFLESWSSLHSCASLYGHSIERLKLVHVFKIFRLSGRCLSLSPFNRYHSWVLLIGTVTCGPLRMHSRCCEFFSLFINWLEPNNSNCFALM